MESKKQFGESKQLCGMGDEWTRGVADRVHIHTESTARQYIYAVGSKEAGTHTLNSDQCLNPGTQVGDFIRYLNTTVMSAGFKNISTVDIVLLQ